MAKNTKTVRKAFEYRSCDDFAAYLNHIARQGWHFTGWRAGLVFEKGEPEDAVYAVEVFSGASEYDTRPEPNTKEFADYCEAAGWQFIDSTRKFVVFKRVREDALPIFTDEERFENVKSVTYGGPGKLLLAHLLILGLMIGAIWSSPKVYLFSLSQILWSVYWPLVFLRDLWQTINYRRWCKDCENRLDQGEPLYFRKQHNSSLTWFFAGAPLIVSIAYFLNFDFFSIKLVWILTCVFLVLTVLMSYLPRRLRMDTVSCQVINVLYWTIFIIFMISLLVIASYQDMAQPEPEPPVSISVFRPFEAATDVELSRDTTPFGSRLSCYLYTEDDRISYFVYESSYDWVLDAVWNQELKNAANTESCTEAWAAMDAFRKDSGRYVVHYGNKILILNPGPEPLNQDQIDTIISALKEG